MSEETQLKALHHQRGALKRKLNDFIAFINELKDIQEISLVHIKSLKTRIEQFTLIIEQLQEIQNKIFSF